MHTCRAKCRILALAGFAVIIHRSRRTASVKRRRLWKRIHRRRPITSAASAAGDVLSSSATPSSALLGLKTTDIDHVVSMARVRARYKAALWPSWWAVACYQALGWMLRRLTSFRQVSHVGSNNVQRWCIVLSAQTGWSFIKHRLSVYFLGLLYNRPAKEVMFSPVLSVCLSFNRITRKPLSESLWNFVEWLDIVQASVN